MSQVIEIDGQRIDVESSLRALDRADCEDSLYTFVQHAWERIESVPFIGGWPMEAICEHLEAVVDGQIRRLLINIPPRTSKSSIVSVAFPPWVWAQRHKTYTSGPGVKFLCASHNLDLAQRDLGQSSKLIKSDWYQSLWADRYGLVKDAERRVINSKSGGRLIRSIEAGATGEGGDIILIDDPNDASDANSETMREKVIAWWSGTMTSRLNNRMNGAFIIIQQRLAEDDLTGYIQEKHGDGWDQLILPMRYEPLRSAVTSIGWKDPRTEDGELLWPERFPMEVVEEQERDWGPFTTAGQYQQRPMPAGGGVVKVEWWQPWEPADYPAMDYIIASLDTAYTMKTENDYSAISVWGVFSGDVVAQNAKSAVGGGVKRTYSQNAPKVMLMFAWQQRLELHDLVKKVAKTCKDMKVDKLIIENKAAGHSVAQEMRRIYGHEEFMVQLYDPKSADKLARLHSVVPIFAEEMVFAPDKQWSRTVIDQVASFPKGKHDDLVDTVSMSLRHLRDLGLLQRSAESIAETEESMRYRGPEPGPLYPG